jgi:predicted metal-binding membrane protein
MLYDPRDWARLRNCMLAVSLIAWVILFLQPRVSSCCSVNAAGVSWEMLVALNPPRSLAGNWALMLVAMMAPMLVGPIYHIRVSSFARRRMWSTMLFGAAYGIVWMAAGLLMVAGQLAATWMMPQSYLPATIVGFIALVWQASPFKQRCLNRCHSHPSLAAFGFDADLDVLRMGWEQGLWCVASCWAAMLLPMLLPEGHFIAMVAVAVLMFCERLDPPRAPAWRWRGFGTAGRYLSLRLRGPQRHSEPLTAAS